LKINATIVGESRSFNGNNPHTTCGNTLRTTQFPTRGGLLLKSDLHCATID
jgi:hypothetical protein